MDISVNTVADLLHLNLKIDVENLTFLSVVNPSEDCGIGSAEVDFTLNFQHYAIDFSTIMSVKLLDSMPAVTADDTQQNTLLKMSYLTEDEYAEEWDCEQSLAIKTKLEPVVRNIAKCVDYCSIHHSNDEHEILITSMDFENMMDTLTACFNHRSEYIMTNELLAAFKHIASEFELLMLSELIA